MPWIFGSFLVIPCALTSCHVVISKQDSTIRDTQVVRVCNRKETTWWEPHGQIWTRSRSERRLWRAYKVVQALAPPGSWKKIWKEKVFFLRISFSTHLTHTTEISTLSRIKCERYIFYKKSVFVRSLKFVNQCFDYGYTIQACFALKGK